jgi:hypothetical protein
MSKKNNKKKFSTPSFRYIRGFNLERKKYKIQMFVKVFYEY